jgi:hypothetical protein
MTMQILRTATLSQVRDGMLAQQLDGVPNRVRLDQWENADLSRGFTQSP